ncbi:MAG TPA: hypothetical protein VIR29_12490, partial [Anseongella sp.]
MKKQMSGTVAFTRLVTLAAVLLAHHGLGQNYPDGHPQSLPLDGTWEYRLDPKNRGLDEKWYAHSF